MRGEFVGFYENFYRLCEQKNKSLSAVAKELGLSNSIVTYWKRSNAFPRGETLEKIADYFGVSVGYLMGWESSEAPAIPPGFEPLPKMVKVPLVGEIACGVPILAEQNMERYVDMPEGCRADFALLCHGDSMINVGIQEGDIVYIRQQPTVENGQIAAVLIDNEATLKHVYLSGNTLVLQPANINYAPMTFSGEALNDVRIEGLVVGFTHWF
mgnify:CR=1 FL=1